MLSDTAFISGVAQILFISQTFPTPSLRSSSNVCTMHYLCRHDCGDFVSGKHIFWLIGGFLAHRRPSGRR